MCRWIKVARLDECPPGESLEAVVDEQLVAVFNVDGEIYAIDGICAHQGGPIAQGAIRGATVACPWHGWQYDVRTGRQLASRTARQRRFNVRVEADTILIGDAIAASSCDDG